MWACLYCQTLQRWQMMQPAESVWMTLAASRALLTLGEDPAGSAGLERCASPGELVKVHAADDKCYAGAGSLVPADWGSRGLRLLLCSARAFLADNNPSQQMLRQACARPVAEG